LKELGYAFLNTGKKERYTKLIGRKLNKNGEWVRPTKYLKNYLSSK
jgi:hypothetical protein